MKCIGCGINLQSENSEQAGYVDYLRLVEQGEEVYCKRCFDIIHYNKKYCTPTEAITYYEKLKILNLTGVPGIAILLIDVIDIYGGVLPRLVHLLRNIPVILVINKIDLMPKSIKVNHIEEAVRLMGASFGINIDSVYTISAKSTKNIDAVLRRIDRLRFPDKRYRRAAFNVCYVIGCASVGKSTFINAVKKYTMGVNKSPITTSDQFQTTQGIIKVDIGNGCYMIDTPGIINEKSFYAYLDYESIRMIAPKTYLKVRTYQLDNQQTLFFGGLVRLDFVEGENISVSSFVSNLLYIHRTKLENADEIYQKHRLGLLSPPITEEEFAKLGELKTETLTIEDPTSFFDLIIPGIGVIHIKGEGIVMKLTMSSKIDFRLVRSII